MLPAVLAAALLAGCSTNHWVTLRSTPKNPLSDSLYLLAPGGPRPTPRTMQLLRRYDLVDDLGRDRRELLGKLHEVRSRDSDPELLYAVSELAYLGAKQSELVDEKLSLDLYGTSVMHAFMYLFGDEKDSGRNPYDPQFRGACELYNAGLEGTLRIARKQGDLKPGHVCSVRTATRQIDVAMVLKTQSWREEDLDRFEFVSDYQVNGLKNHYHTYGLGTPLIAIRDASAGSSPQERFYPAELTFPVTALLRVRPARTSDDSESASAPAQAVLELYDPLESSNVSIADRTVPLESDLSTPLAVFLNQPQLDEQRLATLGLLNPGAADELAGLYMLEPYRPGKIPVLMVHGLWSTPVTWMEMFNDLRSDPEVRRHYQFWFYLYPTGQPFWISAARLRYDLAEVRRTLDPHQQQPALDQLVLVGHSMGGLVSKLQTVDSGDRFWRTVSDASFSQVQAPQDVRERLASVFFFQPSPSIRRVVTIGTPHRGSDFANDTTRWLGRKLIAMPARFLMGREALLRDNAHLFRSRDFFEIQTSIDSLAPESPLLPVLLEADAAPWVRYHNVVGRRPEPGILARFAGEGDGIVSLTSASLETASSQIVVPADHMGVHRHPRSILEVRRVLMEHLNELRGSPGSRVESPEPEGSRVQCQVSSVQSRKSGELRVEILK